MTACSAEATASRALAASSSLAEETWACATNGAGQSVCRAQSEFGPEQCLCDGELIS